MSYYLRQRFLCPLAKSVGWLAFLVFGIASFAQVIVGKMLDRHGPRTVFAIVALIQVVFFMLMPGQTELEQVYFIHTRMY